MNITLVNKLEFLISNFEILTNNVSIGEKISILKNMNQYSVICMGLKNPHDLVIFAEGAITLCKLVQDFETVNLHTIASLKDGVDAKFFNTVTIIDPSISASIGKYDIIKKDVIFSSTDLLTYYLGVRLAIDLVENCVID